MVMAKVSNRRPFRFEVISYRQPTQGSQNPLTPDYTFENITVKDKFELDITCHLQT